MERNTIAIEQKFKSIHELINRHKKTSNPLKKDEIIDLKYQIKTLLLLTQITPESNLVMNICKLNLNNFPKYNLENDRKQQFPSDISEKLNKIINLINTTEDKSTKEDYNTWLLSYFIWNFEQKNDKILTDTDTIAQSVKEHQKRKYRRVQ